MKSNSKKILITGAEGFIGSHLVELLLSEGVDRRNLRLFVKDKNSLNNLPDENFDFVFGDIRNKKDIKKAMKDVDTVYHLAARVDFEGESYQEYKDVNVDGTRNLLEECKGKKIQKFVFFSSIAVFGLPADVGDIRGWDEKQKPGKLNLYGKSKLEAEKKVIEAYRKHKIPYAIIRPASVYGPRDRGATYGLYKAIKGGYFFMIGNGKNKLHYVYVGDIVKAARLAQTSKRKTGDYIIAGPSPVTLKHLVACISKSIDKKPPKVYIPKSLAEIMAGMSEKVFKPFGIKPPIYPSRVRTMTTTYYYNLNKAKNEIKYNPQVSFKEGSKITGKWYLDNGWL